MSPPCSAGYPFDVLLGSVHWIGTWRFDDLADPVSMGEWPARAVDDAWSDYVTAIEELAASGTCDVLAHPDLVKVAGHRPADPRGVLGPPRGGGRVVGDGRRAVVRRLAQAGGRGLSVARLLERFVRHGVPLTTASDAHRLADVADRSAELAALLGGTGRRHPPGLSRPPTV